MKLFLSFWLLSTLFVVSFGSKLPYKWLDNFLHKDGNVKGCQHRDYFEGIFNEIKKQYPSANTQDLVKLLTKEMMNDTVHDPIIAYTIFSNDYQDFNNSNMVAYVASDATISEAQHVEKFFKRMTVCQMENNFSMVTIPRNIFNKTTKSYFRGNFKKLINKNFSNSNRVVSCRDNPKVQAVIDAVNKMGIENEVQWAEKCAEQLKSTLNFPEVTVTKLNTSTRKISAITLVTEKARDFGYCMRNPDDSHCVQCVGGLAAIFYRMPKNETSFL